MKDIIKYYSDNICVDNDGAVKLQVGVEIRRPRYNQKNVLAEAKIAYAGLIISDILIIKGNNDALLIEFPSKEIVVNKKTKTVASVFPGVPELSKQFNKIISDAYHTFCYEEKYAA